MENCVYVIYNKLSKRYEGVMSFASDGVAIHRLSDKLDLEEQELCRVGTIDISTGVITPENPVRLVTDVKPRTPIEAVEKQ